MKSPNPDRVCFFFGITKSRKKNIFGLYSNLKHLTVCAFFWNHQIQYKYFCFPKFTQIRFEYNTLSLSNLTSAIQIMHILQSCKDFGSLVNLQKVLFPGKQTTWVTSQVEDFVNLKILVPLLIVLYKSRVQRSMLQRTRSIFLCKEALHRSIFLCNSKKKKTLETNEKERVGFFEIKELDLLYKTLDLRNFQLGESLRLLVLCVRLVKPLVADVGALLRNHGG